MFVPPEFLVNLLPEELKPHAALFWYGLLGVGLLIFLWIGVGFVRRLFGGRDETPSTANLVEDLGAYPPPPRGTGDRQLRVEGVPVRIRLVVLAPTGRTDNIDEDAIDRMLSELVAGLGEIYKFDRPRVRIWPAQVSYDGFSRQFHQNTLIPGTEKDPVPWVALAGRAKLGGRQVMIGLALQANAPTTVGRRTLESHEWATVLRVRVRDGG